MVTAGACLPPLSCCLQVAHIIDDTMTAEQKNA